MSAPIGLDLVALDELQVRAFKCEAILSCVRAEAMRGEWGLAPTIIEMTDGLGLPERHQCGPERVPAWVCDCALKADPERADLVPCSPGWCQ